MGVMPPYGTGMGRPSPSPTPSQQSLNPVANNFQPMGGFLPPRPNMSPLPQPYRSPVPNTGYPQFHHTNSLQTPYAAPQPDFVKPSAPTVPTPQHGQHVPHQLPMKPPPPQYPHPQLPSAFPSGYPSYFQSPHQSPQMLRSQSGSQIGFSGPSQTRFTSPNTGYSSASTGSSPVIPQFNQMPYHQNTVGTPNFSQYQQPHQQPYHNMNSGTPMGSSIGNNSLSTGNNAWPSSLPPRPPGGLPYSDGRGPGFPPPSTYGGYGMGRG